MNTTQLHTELHTYFEDMSFEDLQAYRPKNIIEEAVVEDVWQRKYEICHECGGDREITISRPATVVAGNIRDEDTEVIPCPYC